MAAGHMPYEDGLWSYEGGLRPYEGKLSVLFSFAKHTHKRSAFIYKRGTQ
jgi:hypothetical protein